MLQAAAEGLTGLLCGFLPASTDAHSPGCPSNSTGFRSKRAENSTGYLRWVIKRPRCYGKEYVLPLSLSCLLVHFWNRKKHWMVSIRSSCRMDEDRKEWKVWIASQCLKRTTQKSYKLVKTWEIHFWPLSTRNGEWDGEDRYDNSTLKWCLSLVCQVKFWEDFPLSFIKNRKKNIKKAYVFTGMAILDLTLEGLIHLWLYLVYLVVCEVMAFTGNLVIK